MHGDKLVSKQKKRNYLTLSAHVSQSRENRHRTPISQRTKRRLEHFNRKFREAEAKRPPAWGETMLNYNEDCVQFGPLCICLGDQVWDILQVRNNKSSFYFRQRHRQSYLHF